MPCLLALLLGSFVLPVFGITSIAAEHSADYLQGFELGRQYAARHGAQSTVRDPARMETTLRQREELERQLIDAREKAR